MNQDLMVFFSRNSLPKIIKDRGYVINLDEYADVGTHWIALFCNGNETVYFDMVLNMFLKKLNNLLGIKAANIFQVQANDSLMCGYFCIRFIDVMLTGKKLTDFTNLFSPYDFEKIDHIILDLFQWWMKVILSN